MFIKYCIENEIRNYTYRNLYEFLTSKLTFIIMRQLKNLNNLTTRLFVKVKFKLELNDMDIGKFIN